MTDLTTTCPKCERKVTNYFHFVDRYGMSDTIPAGTYEMTCAEQYATIPRKDCGFIFKVRVKNLQKVEVLK